MRLVLLSTITLLPGFGLVQTSSAGIPDGPRSDWEWPEGYPTEPICFPSVPGIDNCNDVQVAIAYLSEPIMYDSYGIMIPMELNQMVRHWGYPLTELRWERNADGHCVLTQWFERAVFEYHSPGASWIGARTLRRLGAELRGDTQYEPQLCTAEEHFSER